MLDLNCYNFMPDKETQAGKELMLEKKVFKGNQRQCEYLIRDYL